MGVDMDTEYFVSINEVAKRLSVPAHTLRYWEKQFPTAIRPTTGAGGRRYYRAETVARLETIKALLYDKGMTIAGVKKLIHDGDFIKGVAESSISVTVAQPQKITKPATQTGYVQSSDEIDTVISYLNAAREILTSA